MKAVFYLCKRYRERCQDWPDQINYCKILTIKTFESLDKTATIVVIIELFQY